MKHTIRRIAIWAAVPLLLLVLTACGAQSTEPSTSAANSTTTTSKTSQVVVALSTESEPTAGFNPIINWGSGEHMHEPLIQSTLITTDANLNFHNDLATDYSVSSDGLTWTFKIRDDVKFSDGKPLTAADVAFTINKIINTKEAETDLSMINGAEAPDKTTVVLTLNRPYNALLYELAVVGIVPEHAYTDDYGTTPQNTIGSGRYCLEQWDRGQQAIFTANPNYYGEKPSIERVVVLFMTEDAAAAAAGAGEVDVAFTTATLANNAPQGFEVMACKSVDSRGLALPAVPAGGKTPDGASIGNDVTAHVEIRRAINMGVDRQRFIDHVLNGYGTVAYSVGTGMPWYSEDMKVDYDPAAAQKILEEAGWSKGDDGIFTKDGQRASIDVIYSTTDSVRQAIATEFANQMKEIGIEVSLKGMSMDEAMTYGYSTPVVWGFGSFNVADYADEMVDEYIAKALAQPTVEQSFDYWKKAQWDGKTGFAPRGDAPWVWICNVDHLFFVREGLHVAEQKPHPHGHGWSVLNNVDQWSWQ